MIIIIHYYSTIDDNKQCFFSKARLFSASAPRASSWLTVVLTVEFGVNLDPSEFGVHLDPSEFFIAIWWCLGVDTSGGFHVLFVMT